MKGSEKMNNTEKVLDMYEAQTKNSTDNDNEIVVDSCCDVILDSCACCTMCASGDCC